MNLKKIEDRVKKSGLSNKLKIDCRIQGYIGINAVLVVQ